ncbi:hypothetical protein HDU97_008294 [Phlyctochytrium planicorne]|nr:hypothetical protein HDU97_008294 [Phlyctochytrium planicorne]
MAERKATNKYYPPDWDPSKGSINKFVGQHPLRDRARKLDQGILIVRFELPYSIWCGGCEKHIGKASGARKREEEFTPEDSETMALGDDEEKKRLEDPMYKLEHAQQDAKRATEVVPAITQLQQSSEKLWKDPYTLSQQLRKRFRADKKVREANQKEAEGVRDKHNLLMTILPATAEDTLQAKLVNFESARPKSEADIKKNVHSSSIFKTSKSNTRSIDGLKQALAITHTKDPFGINQSSSILLQKQVARQGDSISLRPNPTSITNIASSIAKTYPSAAPPPSTSRSTPEAPPPKITLAAATTKGSTPHLPLLDYSSDEEE